MGSLNKYKVIKNFLTKEEQELLRFYTVIKHRINQNEFDFQQCKGLPMFYGDPIMEALMVHKAEIMEKETGLKVLPTYSCWRMYILGADLKKHKDRPSCEISVTVQIASSSKWPLYIDGNEITLEDGDAVIYRGCDVEHWRNEYKSDYHAQVFLHYVDKNGPHRNNYKDGRPLFGLPASKRNQLPG